MLTIVRRYVLALLAVLLSGCAAHVATMKVGGLETSEGLRVRDIRPAQEKEAESFSHLVTSDAYGTFRVADAAITPSALRLLQHRAYEAAAGGKPPADVVVRHFVVYRNMQHVLRRGALAAGLGGIIGAVIAGSQPLAPPPSSTTSFDAATFNAAAASEYKLALVTDEQDPDGAPVYVVYIETEIDGLEKFTKTITPAVIQAAGATPLQGALDDAIKSHLAFKGGSVLAARSVLATAPAIAPAPAAAVVAMVPNTPARVPADSGTGPASGGAAARPVRRPNLDLPAPQGLGPSRQRRDLVPARWLVDGQEQPLEVARYLHGQR